MSCATDPHSSASVCLSSCRSCKLVQVCHCCQVSSSKYGDGVTWKSSVSTVLARIWQQMSPLICCCHIIAKGCCWCDLDLYCAVLCSNWPLRPLMVWADTMLKIQDGHCAGLAPRLACNAAVILFLLFYVLSIVFLVFACQYTHGVQSGMLPTSCACAAQNWTRT